MFSRRLIVPALVFVSTIATLSAANPKEEFAANWEGQAVVLKQRLYTLAYRERGRLGNGTDKRDGIFVVTPSSGTYYQFDGRQSKDDIRKADPQSLAEAILHTYRERLARCPAVSESRTAPGDALRARRGTHGEQRARRARPPAAVLHGPAFGRIDDRHVIAGAVADTVLAEFHRTAGHRNSVSSYIQPRRGSPQRTAG